MIQRFQVVYQSWLSKLGIYTLSSAFAQLLAFVYVIIIAQQLRSEMFGRFTSNYAILTLTAILFNLGLDTWLLRSTEGQADGRTTTGNVVIIKLLIGLVWGIAVVLICTLIRPDLYGFGLILPAALDVFGDGLLNSILVGFNIQRKVQKAGVLLVASRFVRILLTALPITLHTQSPESFAIMRMLATWSVLVAAFFLFRPRIQIDHLAQILTLKQTLPFWLSDILTSIYVQADITLLALIAGEKVVGIYSPASSIVNATFILSSAGYMIFVPEMMRINLINPNLGRRMIRNVFLWFTALGIPLFSLVILFSGWIIHVLFGQSYQQADPILQTLSPLILMKPYEYGCIAILISRNWHKQRLIPQAFSALINMIANVILIPTQGAMGAAIAYLISETVLLTGYLILCVMVLLKGKKPDYEIDR